MQTKQYQHGFIVGKFMPLHNGHVLLLDTAIEQCNELTVLLVSQPDEPIPGNVRLSWLQTLYSNCEIIHHTDMLPRDETGYDNWDVWLDSIKHHCPDQYDVVFSSEEYGKRLADDFGSEHVMVDDARQLVPVSGTTIRNNPPDHFEFLPAIVREYYENQD